MNLAGWRFLAFALIGAAGIVLLASIGVPSRENESFDRHTGERRLIIRNVADAYFDSRSTGDAPKALERALFHLHDFTNHAALLRVVAVMEAELAGPDSAPSPNHPAAETIAAEQQRAQKARELLDQRLREPMNKQSLLALLDHLEADEAIAEAAEEFFRPLTHWPPSEETYPIKPDEMAARQAIELETAARADKPKLFLEIAARYRSMGRPRARIRWLLRAYAALPPDRDLHDELATAYLETGNLKQAFLVVGAALAREKDNLGLWKQRVQLAAWLSLPHEEAEASEVLLAVDPDPERRKRIIDIYNYIGAPGKAVPHLRIIARESDDPAVKERPALYALTAGDIDLALEILDEYAQESGDSIFWREKIITYAEQDLRLDRVERELRQLRLDDPKNDAKYDKRLEVLFKLEDKQEKLVALLEQRLDRNPDDREAEEQVLQLHAGLGNEQRVREIMSARIDRDVDSPVFFANLRSYEALELPGLPEYALQFAKSRTLRREDANQAIGELRNLFALDGFREAALVIARRYPIEAAARVLLVEHIDSLANDSERARAAEALARQHTYDPDYVKVWVERASWAGDTEAEIRAREALLALSPEDRKNRVTVGQLYSALERNEEAVEQWRYLAEREGIRSKAVLRLIDGLMALGEAEEAVLWLEKRASLPETDVEDRLKVAEELFNSQHFDRALRFYLAVLDMEESNALALLRIAQVRSWTNDPRGSIPFFERRLAASEEQAAEVRFYLGEAHWAIGEEAAGARYQLEALEEMERLEHPTTEQELMIAKMFARFGRIDEAEPIFERILEAHPDNIDLLLDYADSMLATRRVEKARELVDKAKLIAPLRSRVMRLDGKVAMLERRYEEAAVALADSIERHGTDAGTESELGRAYELSGDRLLALDAYQRSLTLQPENRDVEQTMHYLSDELAKLGSANFWLRALEQDLSWQIEAAASSPLASDRTRAGVSLGFASYSGRAAAVDDGNTDVTAQAALLGVGVYQRIHRLSQIAAGVDLYPGAPGDLPLGAWAGLLVKDVEPYRLIGLRLVAHELWDDPAAAPGLGGRRSGVLLYGQHDVGERFWAGAEVAYEYLSAEDPAGGTVANGRVRGAATFGARLHSGDLRVAERLALDRNAVPGLVGPFLDADPSETHGPLVSVWTTIQALRLLDDKELAALLPIGERFDYLSLAGRADFHLARGLGLMVETSIGYELTEGMPFGNLDVGLTWRPRRALEFTLRGGYGRDLARADAADIFHLGMSFSYRW